MTGSASPGFPNERRIEPQITVGLLTDAAGFPLMADRAAVQPANTTMSATTIRSPTVDRRPGTQSPLSSSVTTALQRIDKRARDRAVDKGRRAVARTGWKVALGALVTRAPANAAPRSTTPDRQAHRPDRVRF